MEENKASEMVQRISSLETDFNSYRCTVDILRKQIQLLLAESTIITDWICQTFGSELVNRKSLLYTNIHNLDNLQEFCDELSLISCQNRSRRKSQKKRKNTVTHSVQKEIKETKQINVNAHVQTDDKSLEEVENFIVPSSCPSNKDGPNDASENKGASENAPGENCPSDSVCDSESDSCQRRKISSECGESHEFSTNSKKQTKRGRPKKTEERNEKWKMMPMQCDECGKILKGAISLRYHKASHANIRPYTCSLCGKAFRAKNHLNFHIKVHKGEKNYICSICGRGFIAQRDLDRHVRVHTGEKPYKCEVCNKCFNVKQHLTLHIRTHTGERPYKCHICDKSFSQANSLRIHKKIHDKNKDKDDQGALSSSDLPATTQSETHISSSINAAN